MMFLSTLLINVGDNPDRPRPGRLWLRNVYRVHQRLCMAFPSGERHNDDRPFLKPYRPEDFEDVHAKRDHNAGFLFRVDVRPGGSAVIVVLSAREPDWDYAFHNARYLLAAPPSNARPLRLDLNEGQLLRFRLAANPTKKVHALRPDAHRKKPLTRNGRRVPVGPGPDELRAWLEERATRAGFRVDSLPLVQAGYSYVNKTSEPGTGYRLRTVRYEGILRVTNATDFRAALASGIGPAKAFGCGLLSVAPLRA